LGTIDPAVLRINWSVLGFAAGLSMLTGVLFGIFPAFHATRPDLASTLKGQAGQPSGARAAARVRMALVVVQVSLSMGLLASAGLFGKSLLNVSRVDLGVQVDQVITFALGPQRNGYTLPRAQALFQDVLTRLAATPGVTAVSAARVPLIGNSSSTTPGSSSCRGEERTGTSYNETSPGYLNGRHADAGWSRFYRRTPLRRPGRSSTRRSCGSSSSARIRWGAACGQRDIRV
jgi:hypothetical protein